MSSENGTGGRIDELTKDMSELKDLLARSDLVKRPRVKTFLEGEVRRLETLVQPESPQEPIASEKGKGDKVTGFTTELKTYGWDQTDKFVKLYVGVPKAHTTSADNLTCTFNNRSFHMKIAVPDPPTSTTVFKRYELSVTGLLETIIPDESYGKLKTDTVLIMLRKGSPGHKWPFVTQMEQTLEDNRQKRFKPKSDTSKEEAAEPGAGIMNMLKNMYDEGDDDLKRTIAKAWTESQDKKGKGIPGMPEPPDMDI